MSRYVAVLLGMVALAAAVDAADGPGRASGKGVQMGKFVDLGVPVTRAGVFQRGVGPDAEGKLNKLYAVFTQNAAPVFLVQIDPATGESRQFDAPIGTHPWGFVIGPDNCVYIGTAGDDVCGGLLLKFDPADPERGLVNLGKMAQSESYIWSLAAGEGDDCIYGTTYGNGKVVSYDTRTGQMRDYGQLRPGQQYSRPVVVGKDGWVYTAVGMTEPDYIALDPRTGEHHSSRPPELQGAPVPELAQGGWAKLRKGTDGHAYQQDNGRWYRLIGGRGEPVADDEVPPAKVLRLDDGRELLWISPEAYWVVKDPVTGVETRNTFEYAGAGMEPFVLGEGPDGCIYGSTMLPLWLFRTDPRTGEHEVLGNPSRSGGELYSMIALDGKLWTFGYPEAYVSSYAPELPWDFGDSPEHNPRNFGKMGDGHLRPRALILGPERKLYVGSFAPYGELGGAMGVFDPVAGEVVENYRNLILNQSISALAYDPVSGLVFGGSDIAGGGGTAPKVPEAVFFIWDPVAKRLLHQTPPVSGDTNVAAMTVADGKVFMVSRPSNTLSAWDIAGKVMMAHRPIPFGGIVEVSMGRHTDGMVYALTRQGVIQIDPRTCDVTQVGKYEEGVSCGWVMNEDGIYFASGVHLVRWEWPR